MFKHFKYLLLIVVLVAVSLPAAVTAQEGPKPEAVGLRPDAPPVEIINEHVAHDRQFLAL